MRWIGKFCKASLNPNFYRLGTDDHVLIDVLAFSSNVEMAAIKQVYAQKHGSQKIEKKKDAKPEEKHPTPAAGKINMMKDFLT